MRRILVADDEENMCWVLSRALTKEGYEVETATDGQAAINKALAQRPELVLLDWKMPKLDGLSALRELRSRYPDLMVIMLTAHGYTAHAVEAMKAGAYDYIMKPFDMDELILIVKKAMEVEGLRTQVSYLKDEVNNITGWAQMIGNSKNMHRLYELVARVAPTSATVLIQGESGTGKELVAYAIYTLSNRREEPFIRVNCAALPENLMESELFGHEKGAFTGAYDRKLGRFELADSGTLFLDEIGELSLPLQAKLLRVLQERSFERVGGVKTIKVDVRVIAATNRDLEREMKENRFREDLFYRLNVVPITVPPLRERPSDIPLLINYYIQKNGEGKGRQVLPGVVDLLSKYHWPGNVRELHNVVERMLIICPQQEISIKYLPDYIRYSSAGKDLTFELPSEGISLEELEVSFLKQALDRVGGNQSQAARLLGLTRYTFLYRLDKYGIDPHWGASS